MLDAMPGIDRNLRAIVIGWLYLTWSHTVRGGEKLDITKVLRNIIYLDWYCMKY